jgi:hypothetical protein
MLHTKELVIYTSCGNQIIEVIHSIIYSCSFALQRSPLVVKIQNKSIRNCHCIWWAGHVVLMWKQEIHTEIAPEIYS